MGDVYLVGFAGVGPLFNNTPVVKKEPCPFCLLYPEFECSLCKEE
jgi:hypothetical protein